MKTVSLRLDKKTLKRTHQLAKIEHLDASTALRQSIGLGLDTLSKKYALELYANGIFSLSEAAAFADISVGEMMDMLVKAKVKANYTLEDAEDSLKNIGKLSK